MQDKKNKFQIIFYCFVVLIALLFVFFVGFKLCLNSSLLSFAEESKTRIEEPFDLSNLRGVDCSDVLYSRSRSLSDFEVKYSNFNSTGIDNNFYRFTISGDLTALTNEQILKNTFGISSFVVGSYYYINVSTSSENQNGYFFLTNFSGSSVYRIYQFYCYKTSTNLLFRAQATNITSSPNTSADLVILNQSYSDNSDTANWNSSLIYSMFYSCLGVGTPISNLNLFTTDYDLIDNSSFYNALFVLSPITYEYDSANNLIVLDKNLLFGTNGSFAISSISYNYGSITYPLSFSNSSGYNSSLTTYDTSNKVVSFEVSDSISGNIAFCINVSFYLNGTTYNYTTLPLLLINMPQLTIPHINSSSNYLYWSDIPNANCYYIYYSEDNSDFEYLVSVYTNSYSAFLNGYYKIVAVDTNALYLNSDFSNIVQVDTYFNPISDYSTYNFYTLFSAIFDVSVYYLQSMLNFTIFGLNFYLLFKLIIVVCLTLIIVKFVNKKGS